MFPQFKRNFMFIIVRNLMILIYLQDEKYAVLSVELDFLFSVDVALFNF